MIQKTIGFFSTLALSLFVALPVSAQQVLGGGNATTIDDIIETIGDILNILIPILITLAIVFFFFALIKYVMAKEDQDKTKARGQMIAGIIALFLMLTIFGILTVISSTFGIGAGGTIDSSMIPNVSG